MTYYNEKGEIIPESEVDLKSGYLVDKTTVHHEAVTHREQKELPGGVVLVFTVVDTPAYDEVTEKTYIKYADHPTEQDRLEAQVLYTATMTSTLLDTTGGV